MKTPLRDNLTNMILINRQEQLITLNGFLRTNCFFFCHKVNLEKRE